MSEFKYSPLLPTGKDDTPYRCISTDYVKSLKIGGRTFIEVDPAGLTFLAEQAMADVSHLLRPGHLAQLRAILDDPEATQNDRFVALEMLKKVKKAQSVSIIFLINLNLSLFFNDQFVLIIVIIINDNDY